MVVYIIIVFAFGAALLYISSRVRRAARAAFESERVETDEFVIVKPEGFINPVSSDTGFVFEAYSKDFGKEDAGNLRQAQAFVRILQDKSFDAVCAETKTDAGEVLLEEASEDVCLIKSEETLENASAYNFYKIIDGGGHQRIYELKIAVLQDFMSDYQNRVAEMLDSFRLK